MREALYDIYIYGEKGKAAPLIVMNTFQGNGSDVYSALCTMTEKELNLAVISDINWNEEMSPWECAPLYKNDSPYTGGADKYLDKGYSSHPAAECSFREWFWGPGPHPSRQRP